MRVGLTGRILIGLIAGVATGVVLHAAPAGYVRDTLIVDGVCAVGGQMFLRAIQMLVAPLVLVSITAGAANLGGVRGIGAIGTRMLVLYLFTTAVAISLALGIGAVMEPGAGLSQAQGAAGQVTAPKISIVQTLTEIIPANPMKALAEGAMLQIIVFALLAGTALAALGTKVQQLLRVIEQANEALLQLVSMVMAAAPVGVWCLVTRTFAAQGFRALLPLATYMVCVLAALLVQLLVVYPLLLRVSSGLHPLKLFRKCLPLLGVAFSTSSSYATLPLTMKTVVERLGVAREVAAFTLPLGATINMDGTAIMQGVATMFVAQVYGVELGWGGVLTVIATATLASIGTAGVPAVGLVMLAMVLQAVGLPLEGIAMIVGVDRILDMSRTCVNVMGDAVCTTVVAARAGVLDRGVYEAEN